MKEVSSGFKGRQIAVFLLLFVFAGILGARLYYWQVQRHDWLTEMAQREHFQGEIVPRSKERRRTGQNDPKKGQHDPLTLMANSLPSTIS